jgi:hypothetical protein
VVLIVCALLNRSVHQSNPRWAMWVLPLLLVLSRRTRPCRIFSVSCVCAVLCILRGKDSLFAMFCGLLLVCVRLGGVRGIDFWCATEQPFSSGEHMPEAFQETFESLIKRNQQVVSFPPSCPPVPFTQLLCFLPTKFVQISFDRILDRMIRSDPTMSRVDIYSECAAANSATFCVVLKMQGQ